MSGTVVPDIFAPLPTIEAYLDSTLPPGGDDPPALREAMRYAVLGPGKRLRPLLAWWSAVAVGGVGASSLPCGRAIELVHAFSLVHDDLPALDNDDVRRGRPTLHKQSGEAMAILAGDQLLAEALRGLLRERSFDGEMRAWLAGEVAGAVCAMVRGQALDTHPASDAPRTDRSLLENIHRQKTGALIVAACVTGAASVAGVREDAARLGAIRVFGENIGTLYQASDDLLDATQHEQHVGKRTGKDAALGKLTYPLVFGIGGTREKIDEFRTRALAALEPLGAAAGGLASLADAIATRTR